jgi:hypothetical protein
MKELKKNWQFFLGLVVKFFSNFENHDYISELTISFFENHNYEY